MGGDETPARSLGPAGGRHLRDGVGLVVREPVAPAGELPDDRVRHGAAGPRAMRTAATAVYPARSDARDSGCAPSRLASARPTCTAHTAAWIRFSNSSFSRMLAT